MKNNVKGVAAVIFSILLVSAAILSGCSSEKGSRDEKVTALMETADRAASVTMYYGYQCYSYYKEDPESIKEVADAFRSMTLEETDQSIDEATSFTVYFVVNDEESVSVDVDKNGIFWLSKEQKFYKDVSGTFDYDVLADLYAGSGGNMEPNAACELNLD
ncbi:hypothetical protein GPL15_00690 [Clostridium sp. MCC353]|uniref:hypothetical protein n=1 Tax=Clostridium sp. MCC353 TaxID=2592646 RepID=UPI001C0385EF|nr:hypothetical protein [Clostridium sp. MCC353]MBT9775025.1 hypothetical protein [Clostridium sp. MCC353]